MKTKTLFEVAVKFEKELALPNNFFMNLLNEVIKLNLKSTYDKFSN